MGGRFALSDDSHSTDQVGLNYSKVLAFMENTGITHIHCFTSKTDNSFHTTTVKAIPIEELKKHRFFT